MEECRALSLSFYCAEELLQAFRPVPIPQSDGRREAYRVLRIVQCLFDRGDGLLRSHVGQRLHGSSAHKHVPVRSCGEDALQRGLAFPSRRQV